ncbi:MAG: hypothetical protein ACRDPY_17540 [Streptosporangiaceae bacterium]
MTAATRVSSAAPRRAAAHRPGLPTLRLLRLELRHNAMAWLLPVVFALFWLVTYRKTMAMPPLWNLRAAGLQTGAVADFAVPVTGAAAWMGSREARRRVTDQVTITARPRWARLLVTWAATAIWAMLAYLGCLAVVYGVTAHQATWGGPLWWPAAVAAASVLVFCALGFVVGALLPSRFTAPLVAIAAFFVLALSTEPITDGHSPLQVSPIVTGPWDMGAQAGVATFYPFQPDLSIAQVMFLAGLTVALLGVLGLPARSPGRALRAAAAGCAVAGLLAAGTAVGLTGTGTMDAAGMIDIPALHDAASDRPLEFTPACSRTAIPVCLNPAYATYLRATASALAPLLSELAGLPGAPARIDQEPVAYQQGTGNVVDFLLPGPAVSGTPPAFGLVLPDQLGGPAMTAAQQASQVVTTYGPDLVADVTGDGRGASQAQNAVATGLMMAAGLRRLDVYQVPSAQPSPARQPPTVPGGPDASRSPDVAPGTPAYAAAERFAALPPAARHSWLAAHLAALRAGRLTLAQLP